MLSDTKIPEARRLLKGLRTQDNPAGKGQGMPSSLCSFPDVYLLKDWRTVEMGRTARTGEELHEDKSN